MGLGIKNHYEALVDEHPEYKEAVDKQVAGLMWATDQAMAMVGNLSLKTAYEMKRDGVEKKMQISIAAKVFDALDSQADNKEQLLQRALEDKGGFHAVSQIDKPIDEGATNQYISDLRGKDAFAVRMLAGSIANIALLAIEDERVNPRLKRDNQDFIGAMTKVLAHSLTQENEAVLQQVERYKNEGILATPTTGAPKLPLSEAPLPQFIPVGGIAVTLNSGIRNRVLTNDDFDKERSISGIGQTILNASSIFVAAGASGSGKGSAFNSGGGGAPSAPPKEGQAGAGEVVDATPEKPKDSPAKG